MAKNIALQLYSVRDYAKEDFVKTLKKVADIGYKAVEPAGFWNLRPTEFKKIVNDMGMEISSSHSPWASNPDALGEVMDTADAIGLKTIVTGYGPDNFKDMDAIKRTAENTNKILEVLSRNGYSLMQHNHNFEFDARFVEIKSDEGKKMIESVEERGMLIIIDDIESCACP